MSKKIYKFQLKKDDIQLIEMSEDAEILTVQMQGENPCLWAIVNTDAPLFKRCFETYGIGQIMPENANRTYIGTYQMAYGALVFHVFELHNLN